jgi:hypothetical protein
MAPAAMTVKRSPRSRLYSDAAQNETANSYVIEMLYIFFLGAP